MVSTKQPFYVAGGTLHAGVPSYVERRADIELLDTLMQGQFCYLLDTRQVGKSSMMVRAAERLREQGVRVVLLDLTRVGQALTSEQWYYSLLLDLGSQLGQREEVRGFWQQNLELSPLRRWMEAIRLIVLPHIIQTSLHGSNAVAEVTTGNLVVFVDEIDNVLSLPFSTDEFFAGIREIYTRRAQDPELNRLTFCLLGSATPNSLIRDTKTTPFNIGTRIEPTDFTETEAMALASGLTGKGRNGQALLRRILYWTGGHPYLTQRLCQAVAQEAGVRTAKGVDRLCDQLFFDQNARDKESNIAFVGSRLLKSEEDLASLLSLYNQVRYHRKAVKDDPANPLSASLRLSGIVQVVAGYLWVRNRIYHRVFDRKWIEANMPGAELRRQKAAFHKGLLRTGAVAGVVIAALATLASIAMYQAQLAETKSTTAYHLLYDADMNLIQQAWDNVSIERVQELLKETRQLNGVDRGFEWGYWKRLCDSSMLKLTRRGHNRPVISVAYSPDGKQLVTAGEDNFIHVWDTTTGEAVYKLNNAESVSSVAFSSDGKYLISWQEGASASQLNENRIRIRNAKTGKLIRILQSQRLLAKNQYLPFNKYRVYQNASRTCSVWNLATGKELPTLIPYPLGYRIGNDPASPEIAVSSDGKRIATCHSHSIGGLLGSVTKVWDTITGKEVCTLGVNEDILTMVFSQDNRHIATGSFSGTVKIWDARTGQEINTLRDLAIKGQSTVIYSLAFSPDGKHIAIGASDGVTHIWDCGLDKQVCNLQGHTLGLHSVAFSPDGKYIATASYDHTARVWDAITGHVIMVLSKPDVQVLSVAFSPDSRQIITGCFHDRRQIITGCFPAAKVWDAFTGRQIMSLAIPDQQIVSGSCGAFSPDGKRIALSANNLHKPALYVADFDNKVLGNPRIARFEGDIFIYDASTGHELLQISNHNDSVGTIAFSPDSKRILASSIDGDAKIWDATTGQEIMSLTGHTGWISSVAYSPDGTRTVTGGQDNTAKVWDSQTGHNILTLTGHAGGVTSVVFSPDGKRIITGSEDNTAKIWDSETGRELLTLKAHKAAVTSVAISPDGKRIVTGSMDRTAKIWESSNY